MNENSFKIGISKVDISPPKGIELCGYASRNGGNTGMHDNLFAKAIVVDDGVNKVSVICCDLIGLDSEIVSEIRNKINKRTGIQPNGIMISCSHTHAGPATMHNNSIGNMDENYITSLKSKLVEMTETAASDLRPADAFYYSGKCNIGINRRGRIQEGSIEPFPDPNGFTDNQVLVIAFYETGNNKPIAILFNYGCHPTVGTFDNLLASADFPGTACSYIEKTFNNRTAAAFSNGGAGNINPIVRGSYKAVKMNGEKLAESVIECMKTKGEKLDPVVSFNVAKTILPYNVISKEELEKIIAENKNLLKNAIMNSVEEKIYKANIKWADKFLEKTVDGKVPNYLNVTLQVLNIGGAYLIGIPGEVFAETSAGIKNSFLDNIIVVSYANGNFGYVPTEDEIRKGGYEVMEAYKYYDQPGSFSGEAEKNIRNTSVKLISSLKNSE